jgi:outer membrane protein assembly factor BamB
MEFPVEGFPAGISSAIPGDATLAVKESFSRSLGTPGVISAPEIEHEPVVVAGENGPAGDLIRKWQTESVGGDFVAPVEAPLAGMVHSRLPLVQAPLIYRKWQGGWTPGGPHNLPSLAPEFLYTVPAGGPGAVFLNTSETLHAFDPVSGKLLWTRGPSEATFADPPPRSLPNISLGACGKQFHCALSPTAVFFRLTWSHRATNAPRSVLYAARRSDGALLWSTAGHPFLDQVEFISDPVAGDGTVVIAAWQAQNIPVFLLIGLDAETGEMLWNTHLFSGTPFPWIAEGPFLDTAMAAAPPTIHDQTAYYCTGAGVVVAVDILDGSIRWMRDYPRCLVWGPQPWGARLLLSKPSSPIVVDGDSALLLPRESNMLLVLDTASGAEKGRYESPSIRYLIGLRGRLVLVQEGTSIVGLRVSDLSEAWRADLPAAGILGAPTLTPRGILCPSGESLFVVDPRDGSILETLPWQASGAFGNILDLGDRLVGVSSTMVHILGPDRFSEPEWRLPLSADGGPGIRKIPDREGDPVRWVLPAVDRGDFYFDPDAPDLILTRAPDSMLMHTREPVPVLVWEVLVDTYYRILQFDEEATVLAGYNHIQVIDNTSGATLWSKELPHRGEEMFLAGAFPEKDRVFAFRGGEILCCRKKTGETLWNMEFPGWRVRGIRPRDRDVGVYLQTTGREKGGEAILLDGVTGAILKVIPISSSGGHGFPYCYLVPARKAGDGSGAALDEILVDQSSLARVDWDAGTVRYGPAHPDPRCPGGGLERFGDYLAAFATDGQIFSLWDSRTLDRVKLPGGGRWGIHDGVYYLGSNRRVRAIDLRTGRELWQSRPFAERMERVFATEDSVFLTLRSDAKVDFGGGEVVILDRETGEVAAGVKSLGGYFHKSGGMGERFYASDYTYLYSIGSPRGGSGKPLTLAMKRPDPDALASVKIAGDVDPDSGTGISLSRVSPVIDGNLADWSGADWISLSGATAWQPDSVLHSRWLDRDAGREDPPSAMVAVAGNAESGVFSVAVRAQDNRHVAPPRRELWRGDSVSVAFLDAGQPVQSIPFVYTIGSVEERPCVTGGAVHQQRPLPVDPTGLPGGLLELVQGNWVPWIRRWRSETLAGGESGSIPAVVVRDESAGETVYEFAVPGPGFANPENVRWDLAVNDDDGNGRRGCLQFSSGIWTVEAPAGYLQWPGPEETK